MTNRFKRFTSWLRRNLFPEGFAVRSTSTRQPGGTDAPDEHTGSAAHCHNEPVLSVTPQPLPEISVRGQPAPRHLPAGLESALPPYPVVWCYFVAKKYPAEEAENFYNRFQMVSWESFGIKPIEHWQQLADQWMLNTQKEK